LSPDPNDGDQTKQKLFAYEKKKEKEKTWLLKKIKK